MTPAIVGMGLVSPFGRSPREHVFFGRAHVPGPFTSPFVTDDDTSIRVFHCPWLDAALPIAERLVALTTTALDDALAPIAELGLPAPKLQLCLSRARPGLDVRDLEAVTEAIRTRYHPSSIEQVWAEAGIFAALKEAEAQLARNDDAIIALLAVDSYVSLGWLTHVVEHPKTRWESARPRPSEAAAALLLMSPKGAHRYRLPVLGTILKSALAVGAANDDNDEPVDALAMGAALREVGSARVPAAFGQSVVDALRREDWYRAVSRQSERFWDCRNECLESAIGSVGAAAGAANLVYGAAEVRHCAALNPSPSEPFIAWAISRDGTRGVASVSVQI